MIDGFENRGGVIVPIRRTVPRKAGQVVMDGGRMIVRADDGSLWELLLFQGEGSCIGESWRALPPLPSDG